jgi:hypothetical protein
MLWLSDEALRNSIHVMGGPGSGKSRLMGRGVGWLFFLRRIPTVIFDPTGGTIDNFLSKIIPLEEGNQRLLWPRVTYVDMGSPEYIMPWPLYYRTSADDTLFAISNRYLEVIRRLDPYLQTASVEGWNALVETGTYTGMILSALGLQITEAPDLINRPQRWKGRFEEALAANPEVEPAVSFFRALQNLKPDLRSRRTRAFLNKLLPFTADPGMQAMFGSSEHGIDWQQTVERGQTVLLDFRSETNLERRRFKMLWCFTTLVEFLKSRGLAGRDNPMCLMIDEVTQLLGFRTIENSVMAEDLEELVSVIARNYGVYLCIAHQSLAQLDDRIKNVLMQMGTQIIGVTPNPEDARYLAEQFLNYDPHRVKKEDPVWMGISTQGIFGSYTTPTIIDYTTSEYTPEEQLLMTADQFKKLGRFRFIVRAARGEGQIAGSLQRMSIENLDKNRYPDDELTSRARELLRRRDGVRREPLLTSIRARLSAEQREKPVPPEVVTIEEYAYDIQVQTKVTDDEEIILREEA